MSIDYRHREYNRFASKWQKVEDVCESQNLSDHLLDLNPTDTSPENAARNTQYKERAVFSNIAGYTARGLLGLVFSKDPEVELPPDLEYLTENADGKGVSIFQQSQDTVLDLIKKGRNGLWVDFPKQNEQGVVSKKDLQDGKAFAVIHRIDAKNITNWRTTQIGSRVLLSLVVIRAWEEKVKADGYETESSEVYYELMLVDPDPDQEDSRHRYMVRIWEDSGQGWAVRETMTPTKADGTYWEEIPFLFCGSEVNTWDIDQPPIFDLVQLNIAHYNNSAIYEDSVYTVGQAQPWASGLQADDVKLMEADKFYIGSGRLLALPSGEKFEFAQVEPNTLAKEAKDDKVKEMIGIGAMFIQPGSAVKTATQSRGEQRVQHSILSLIAANVSEAYTKALLWCGMYMGVELSEENDYSVNQDFIDPEATPQDLQQVVSGFLQGAIPISDYHDWMKKHGYSDPEKTLEQFQQEIVTEPATDLDDDPEGEEDEEEDDS